MKTSILSFLVCTVFYLSCKENSNDNVKDFIPGLYARAFEDSITETTKTVGIDTLEIREASSGGSELYEIERRMRFRRTVDGELKPEEYKTENWRGIYDKDKKIIQEISKGKTLSFLPERNVLLVNNAEYKKLK
jgi:hypothetical protein